jgi:hypothetical protein
MQAKVLFGGMEQGAGACARARPCVQQQSARMRARWRVFGDCVSCSALAGSTRVGPTHPSWDPGKTLDLQVQALEAAKGA